MRQQKLQPNPSKALENSLFKQGFTRIIGIDEAGRGCWAGPVAVAAFILTPETLTIQGVNDSKQISVNKRRKVFEQFEAHQYKVYLGSNQEVDAFGIAKVIEAKIVQIIQELNDGHTYFLIDGRFSAKFPGANSQIIKGDSLHYSIAAASIVAKVTRDKLMQELDLQCPGYGLAKHKGYGTAQHFAALTSLGICSLHRLSFEPIKSLYAKQNAAFRTTSRANSLQDIRKSWIKGA